jgi:hypothetical protein
MKNILIVNTTDGAGTRTDYIKIKEIESFSIIKNDMCSINMKTGYQFQIYKKFANIKLNNKAINWEELPNKICKV